jgi:thymidylate synthase
MRQYVELIQHILREGEHRADRTGEGTLAVFGGRIKFDLRESFPLVTFKKTAWRSAFVEMLWFLRGEPNLSFLHEHNVKIWDEWADKDGNLGPIYGVQWRKWPGREGPIDQIKNLIELIKKSPTGRRHIVTAWNPADIHLMGLPPCHRDFQCYVSNDGHLDLMMSQRSWDVGLGAPFNIAQYALLTHMLARATGLKARHLSINHGDTHLYMNHVPQLKDWLTKYDVIDCKPQLVINTDNVDIDGYKLEDFDISGYNSNPFLKLPIAV